MLLPLIIAAFCYAYIIFPADMPFSAATPLIIMPR